MTHHELEGVPRVLPTTPRKTTIPNRTPYPKKSETRPKKNKKN